MDWHKYQHIERLNTDEVEGILDGKVYIFSKLDGTNTGVYLDTNGNVRVNSRNRLLSEDNDNAGACAYVLAHDKFKKYLDKHPNHYLYGEFLIKNRIRTYKDDAWNKLYIFDVVEYKENIIRYLSYEEYIPLLEEFNIEYIPYVDKFVNPSLDDVGNLVDKGMFLQKSEGFPEGIIIKNYDFVNKYGRTIWAKIVREEFKCRAKIKIANCIEQQIIDKLCTSAFIEKEYEKIITEQGWNSKLIPKLLGTIWHTFITEECWNIVKKYKNPKIDFRVLNQLLTAKIKDVKHDVF